MRVVLVGDICAGPKTAVPAALPFLDAADAVVGNLEGPIVDGDPGSSAVPGGLLNDARVIQVLDAHRIRAVSLANNHMTDLPHGVESTRRRLASAGIASFGAGRDLADALSPHVITVKDERLVLMACSWRPIGGRPATRSRSGYAPLEPSLMFSRLRACRREHPGAAIVVLTHWNYEFESAPQPAHRRLAADLLDAGADAIVGHHSHLAGGAECWDGKPAAYSLGNWFFTGRGTDGVPIVYPPESHVQLAIELQVAGGRVLRTTFHWCRFRPQDQSVLLEASESWGGPRLTEASPFTGMPHDAYARWFATHRRRRRLLPIYADYRSRGNRLRDAYVDVRHRAIRALVAMGLKPCARFRG